MLEKMDLFFEARLRGYDEHMLRDIEGAADFYPFTAAALPAAPGTRLLDLGCGTGLELRFYFALCPDARVTGIDLSEGMLQQLRQNFPGKNLCLRCGSYFDEPLGENVFDAAVSVESLHHFTLEEKAGLYRKLHAALIPGGYFILTDYLAPSQEEETLYRQELLRLKQEQGLGDGEFYHYDTPLTLEHELRALELGGFSRIDVLKNWAATYCIKATK